jgi:hypothetical protein
VTEATQICKKEGELPKPSSGVVTTHTWHAFGQKIPDIFACYPIHRSPLYLAYYNNLAYSTESIIFFSCFFHPFFCFVKPGHPHVLSSVALLYTLRSHYVLVRPVQETFSHVTL